MSHTHRSSWYTWLWQRWASRSGRIPGRTWQPRTSRPARSPRPDRPVRSLAVRLLRQPGVEAQKCQRNLRDRHPTLPSSILGGQPTNELSVAVNQELFLLRLICNINLSLGGLEGCVQPLRILSVFVICLLSCFVYRLCVCFLCLIEWMSFQSCKRGSDRNFVSSIRDRFISPNQGEFKAFFFSTIKLTTRVVSQTPCYTFLVH